MKRTLILFVLATLVLGGLTLGVGAQEIDLTGFIDDWEPTDVGPKVIGIVPWSMAQEFNSTVAETSKRLCEQLGWTARIYDPDSDWTKMVQIVEDLIIQQVDGIIFTAIDADAASALVDRVHEEGIKIVAYDCTPSAGNTDMDVVYDDYMGGVMAGEQALKALQGRDEATVIVYEAEPSIASSGRRNQGFLDVLAAADMDIKIIQNRTTDRTNDGVYQWALNMYTANPSANLFYLNWGDGASSTWYGLQSAGGTDVFVIGYDATTSHYEIMMDEGPDCTFYASVGMFPKVYAAECVQKLNDIWAGKYQRQGPEDMVVKTPVPLIASEAHNWVP